MTQVVQAIAIASDPTQVALHQQALQFLSTVQQNAQNTWRLALAIFVETNPNGSRIHPAQARFFALRVLDEFLDNRCAFPIMHKLALAHSDPRKVRTFGRRILSNITARPGYLRTI